MKTHTPKLTSLQTSLLKTLLCAGCALFFHTAYAQTKPVPFATDDEFAQWVEQRVLCVNSPDQDNVTLSEKHESTPAFRKRMKEMGFTVDSEDFEGEEDISGPYDAYIITSREPAIMVFGYRLERIFVSADSGTLFSAHLEANPQALEQVVQDQGKARYPRTLEETHKEDGILHAFFADKPQVIAPGWPPMDDKAIEIQTTGNSSITAIGCHEFDL